jgi:hypothetical protein
MFKRINNWHLSALVAIVSIFSLALVQQYVVAQSGWTDPTDLPGGTPVNNLVFNPMVESLDLDGFDITDDNLIVDGNGVQVIQISNGGELCFNGTADCASSWAAAGVTNPMSADLDMGGFNITDTNLLLDGTGDDAVQITHNKNLCLSGDCKSAWPATSGDSLWGQNSGGIYYSSSTQPDVGVGISSLGTRSGGSVSSMPSLEVSGDVNVGGYVVGDAGSVASQGTRLFFDGSLSNSDWLWISRYNENSDTTELRIGMGDNADEDDPVSYMDKFVVGATDTNNSCTSGLADPNCYDDQTWVPRFTVTSQGNVGIKESDPEVALEISSDRVDGSNMMLSNSSGDMRFIFKEYDDPIYPHGDMSIRYNGTLTGWQNWLEFWGRNHSDNNGRPIMTIQRDYVQNKNTYHGIGIGVPAEVNIDGRLRVQSGWLAEDIFQGYNDLGEAEFVINHLGEVGIQGETHTGIPLFINGSGTTGLKLWDSGLHAWNNSRLELKATNDIYLNVGTDDGVGIEVTNPQQILHVKNTGSFADSLLRLENNNDGASFSSQTTQVEFARGPNWATDYSWVGPGEPGIDTPSGSFDMWTTENIPFLFGNNASEKMRITADGRVGIGTASPISKLHIDAGVDVGLYSEGQMGVYAVTNITGGVAGYFQGDIIMMDAMGGEKAYFKGPQSDGAPPAADCDELADRGRTTLDVLNNKLYACTGDPMPTWKGIVLN